MGLLELKSLTVRYGAVTAVDSMSAAVPSGALVGLIGPNGAGKTTAIDAITGMVRYSGSIVFDGDVIDDWPAHSRSRAGLVRTFQSMELFKELTVRENLETYAAVSRRGDTKGVIESSLDLLDIGWTVDKYPSELSHGQARLVSVARALAADPKLLLLDEPAAGLDAHESQWLGAQLRKIVENGSVTVLLVDHDVELIMKICDEIQVLNFGKTIAHGTPEHVRSHPEVEAAYLGTSTVDDRSA